MGAGPSARVRALAAMFGLGIDERREATVVPRTAVPLRSGQLVFVTGPSGSGKSTLLRALSRAAADRWAGLPRVGLGRRGDWPDAPLIDALPTPSLEDALRLLSLAGLNDAFVMLRRPAELSDGQAHRFGLAWAMASVEHARPRTDGSPVPTALLIADEFGAALDRLTAKAVARNVRRWVERAGACAVIATAHDDLLETLRPEVLVEQRLGGALALYDRGPG
ncbi:MAG: ATP-binding cassette domain-containing protein [Planctomycetota bacterium]